MEVADDETYFIEGHLTDYERHGDIIPWQLDGVGIGFSTSDKIVYSEEAHMHLHGHCCVRGARLC